MNREPAITTTALGYPVRRGPGGGHIPKTVQGLQTLIAWRNRNAESSDYWLRVLICHAFNRMLPRRMQDTPAADLIEIVAEDWVEIIGEGMTEERDRDRIITGFKLIFRECSRWPQPAELLKRLPIRTNPQAATSTTATVSDEDHAAAAARFQEFMDGLEKVKSNED